MIRATQNAHFQALASQGEMNLLSPQGGVAELDPETAKFLALQEEQAKVNTGDFKAALEEMSADDARKLVETFSRQADSAALKQEDLGERLNSLLPENVSRMALAQENAIDSAPQARPTAESLQRLMSQIARGEQASKSVQETDQASLKSALNPGPSALRQALAQVQGQAPVSAPAQAQVQAQTQAQAVIAAPQAHSGQELLDLKQFMERQSTSSKARTVGAQYKNENQSIFAVNASTSVEDGEAAAPASFEGDGSSLLSGEGKEGHERVTDHRPISPSSSAPAQANKVFDLNSLNASGDLETVIKQIQEYVIQAKAAKTPSAQMSFNHPELGDIDIRVEKGVGEQINVTIAHQSQEAAKFFKQSQGDLLQVLQQSGVQVGEFKLESSSNSNQNNGDQAAKQEFAQQQGGGGQDRQRKEDSQRREELWNLLNEERKSA